MDGLAQVNLIVTDFERAKEFWALLGWPPTPRHPSAALVTFPNGMNLVLHEPEFARLWDPAYSGPVAGSTVVDVNLPSRDAADDAHGRVVGPGSVAAWSRGTRSSVLATPSCATRTDIGSA